MAKIKSAFYEAWVGYKKCAFGYDFLKPISCTGENWINASLTLIDSLDTLWLMGLNHDFDDAVFYLENYFEYNASGAVFEMIIRVVGGLLSAYQLSGRQSLLTIAEEFASKLSSSFDTPTSLPIPNIDIATGKATTWAWAPRSTFLSHAGSLAPELLTLAQHTGNDLFFNISNHVLQFFFRQQSYNGLWPLKIDFSTGFFGDLDLSFDAYGDSFYEYLLKLYILTDGQCRKCEELYLNAIHGMEEYLLRDGQNGAYVSSVKSGINVERITHLSFFIPGMLALGSRYFNHDDLNLAIKMCNISSRWHSSTPSGLIGEEMHFINGSIYLTDVRYRLRPEFMESLFYLYRFTGDHVWRDIGWKLFKNIIKHCKAANGFGELKNVERPELGVNDIQDSYLLSETFKYAYLLFSNSSFVPLNKYVFTTEAHPLRKLDQKWMESKFANVYGFRLKKAKKKAKKEEL
ncbi:Mannosyl-oligosaccharide 1,2-alpha-mannosidase MNS1 [Histomonas meleagridis]|uniref:Mannosyl-oligosaccharide 1,2-alpha-mannosidase MNS1 n=1 Tax=Histomonas meleagridis TaxID=135588 RepID=UPI003559A897|nr:Mannosyl-oligosaccharide 1,2-alpha-mannosidase MNS1 [Histomonas meleagridis]KAH0799024.1 Mannosyl-oligosaccharide 1,2-alpha-mannosidase MNS1 [Histomonas meleagridis]